MSPFGVSLPAGAIDASMPSAQLDDNLSFAFSDSPLSAHNLDAQQLAQSPPSGDLTAPVRRLTI
jgi:hypothetical protein